MNKRAFVFGANVGAALLLAYPANGDAADDCFNRSDIAACTSIIDDAFQSRTNRANAYHQRASAFSDMGDYERAVTNINEAMRLDPTQLYYLELRVQIRARSGRDLKVALADADNLVQVTAKDSRYGRLWPRIYRAIINMRLGRLNEAITDYDVALNYQPDYAWPLYGRGLAKLMKGDTEGGNRDLASATQDAGAGAAVTKDFASMGLSPSTLPTAPSRSSSAQANPSSDCGDAELHWKTVDSIGTVTAFQDHLARFPTCAFATLARMKIDAIKK